MLNGFLWRTSTCNTDIQHKHSVCTQKCARCFIHSVCHPKALRNDWSHFGKSSARTQIYEIKEIRVVLMVGIHQESKPLQHFVLRILSKMTEHSSFDLDVSSILRKMSIVVIFGVATLNRIRNCIYTTTYVCIRFYNCKHKSSLLIAIL